MNQLAAFEQTKERLYVDLDGSLIATDLLWECLFVLLKRQPWCVVLVPLWLLRGRANLKAEVARRIRPEVAKLPYNPALLELLQARQRAGVRLILATASPRPWAEAVADHLGCFDEVLTGDEQHNLKGRNKLKVIQDHCRWSGGNRFSYVGDSNADMSIWREAETAYVVTPDGRLSRRLQSLGPGVTVHPIGPARRPIRAAFRALRPHQWTKNALIFVPLVTAQRIFDPMALLAATWAALAFSLCASAIYVVNDLADLAADRSHPAKRRRPFASGQLPLSWGPPLVLILLAVAFTVATLALPLAFQVVLAAYLALTLSYSFIIKSRLMADVLVLAGLYTIRIFAGGVATGIPISEWLIGFSMFLFLSLAFVKRYVELDQTGLDINTDATLKLQGRGYRPSDIGLIETLGPTTGYLAVLVLALYIQSDAVQQFYRSPEWLWPIGLVLLYWISRIWFLAKRGELPGDPVVFALKDRHSLVIGLITVLCLFAGALLP